MHHPSLSSCSTQRGWSCSRCLVPLVPTPRVRDKSQLFSVLPAASQGWGQELPGRAGAGPASARSWGDGGEAGGEARVLPSRLLPHQMLLPDTGMCPLRPCHGTGSLAGEHCCHQHPCPPGPGMAQATTAPSPGLTASVPSSHIPAPFASCLPPTPPSHWGG